MKIGFLLVAVLCCVFVFGSMTAISALPNGIYPAKIGSYTVIGSGGYSTVGFTLKSPQPGTLKYVWKSELLFESYHVQLDTFYYTTSGVQKTVTDDIDVKLMGYWRGQLLQTPDIDTTRDIKVRVTTWRIDSPR